MEFGFGVNFFEGPQINFSFILVISLYRCRTSRMLSLRSYPSTALTDNQSNRELQHDQCSICSTSPPLSGRHCNNVNNVANLNTSTDANKSI